jgi:hypothetical protein
VASRGGKWKDVALPINAPASPNAGPRDVFRRELGDTKRNDGHLNRYLPCDAFLDFRSSFPCLSFLLRNQPFGTLISLHTMTTPTKYFALTLRAQMDKSNSAMDCAHLGGNL